MAAVLWLAVALPAVAAVVARVAPRTAIAGALLSAIPSWVMLASGERARSGFAWLPGGGLDAGLRLDGLSAAMTVTVATVGLAVMVYAAGYFAGEARARSALAGLLAFLAAMQGLVLADGYLTLLIFWELVGAASARLIAYSREDPAAPAGAVRAFLTTRTADLGLYLAVLALFAATGSLAFASDRPDGALGALVGLGIVLAAMGKSAQAPLQTWLSAAMAGPTPVSALLHSATMVAAGVYLLARSHELLAGWPLEVAGWVGALTAVAGAFIALGQTDLKRVLAGSTTSQLGLMFVGAAAGGPAVALFHLVAHAAGKAGLFLAAGVFQHARGTTELAGLRGAGRDDPVAFAGFTVNALSIAAVPPLAAFWSKEHIAAAAETQAAWFVLVLLAAAGSAAYLLRPWLVLAAAAGTRRVADRGRPAMLAGVGATAAGSLALGLAGEPLVRLIDAPELPSSSLSLVLSLLAVAAGAAAVALRPSVPRALATAAARQLHTNEILRRLVQRPLMQAASAADALDRRVVDAAVDGVGRAGLAAARSQDWIERRGIDAAVDGLARLVGAGGDDLRRLQSGRLFEYLRDAVLGGTAVAAVVALSALL
ncbi:MAG: NADH-quinone oxidoreductase subunit 5 family protein [Solirubrobacteraceae bacterium]